MPYEKIGKNEPVCIAEDVPFEIPRFCNNSALSYYTVLNIFAKIEPNFYRKRGTHHETYYSRYRQCMVTKCYNTCFAIENDGHYFLVDGGGGNTIMKQLKNAEIPELESL